MSTYKPTWNKISFAFVTKGFHFLLMHISRQFFIPPSIRPFILSISGIKFKNKKKVFIGTDVLFDTLKGTKTFIGENVYITTGVKIINHYPVINGSDGIKEFKKGDIYISDNVFIGMNTLIIKPITIGKGAIVGAGSVVTKDIPKNAIVAGNPASIVGYI